MLDNNKLYSASVISIPRLNYIFFRVLYEYTSEESLGVVFVDNEDRKTLKFELMTTEDVKELSESSRCNIYCSMYGTTMKYLLKYLAGEA